MAPWFDPTMRFSCVRPMTALRPSRPSRGRRRCLEIRHNFWPGNIENKRDIGLRWGRDFDPAPDRNPPSAGDKHGRLSLFEVAVSVSASGFCFIHLGCAVPSSEIINADIRQATAYPAIDLANSIVAYCIGSGRLKPRQLQILDLAYRKR